MTSRMRRSRSWRSPSLTAALLIYFEPWHASAASSAVQCSDISDAASSHCCYAKEALSVIVSLGGCGSDGTSSTACSSAEHLCQKCKAADAGHQQFPGDSQGLLLSAGNIHSIQLQCESAFPTICTGSVSDGGFGILVLVGVLLLLVATVCFAMFDCWMLPVMVSINRRRLLVEAIEAESAKSKEDKSNTSLEPSIPAPPAQAPRAPPTPSAKPPPQVAGRSSDLLRLAGNMHSPLDPLDIEDDNGTLPSGVSDETMARTTQSGFLSPGRLSRRLASARALHKAFLIIASSTVFLRVIYVVGRLIILVELRSIQDCLPLILAVLPLVWCICTTRPSFLTAGVPVKVAYFGPRQAIPRFTTYAVITIVAELYSTAIDAMAVAVVPCKSSPWRAALLYSIGLLVAAARAYSAVLAVRLQDELVAVCRKVQPTKFLDVESGQTPSAHLEVTEEISENKLESLVIEARSGSPCKRIGKSLEHRGQKNDLDLQVYKPRSSDRWWNRCNMWTCRRSEFQETQIRDFADPDPDEAPLCCTCLPRYCCPVMRRRLAGRRFLLAGILLVVLSAIVSAIVVRSVVKDDEGKKNTASSCTVAQNGTSTCSAFELAGADLREPSGELKMDNVTSMDGCCAGCDEVEDCQAWIFERLDKRCRWIKFLDTGCKNNPGDLRCRCFTSWGTSFGFKPTSIVTWEKGYRRLLSTALKTFTARAGQAEVSSNERSQWLGSPM
eukprot:TRINITY_DN11780_c0_g2_i2.p1 TRINITY_DN11780_c0_g2~~TRINITY_DN11780_c0_g2_i2.p1  ORF type:complete len:724 (+),score=86.85 TRINITY_DN11780_c0_g2_i2:131-2302(+)